MVELILIRHGKSEKRGVVCPDRNRRLVKKGIDQLNQDVPWLSKYLNKKKTVLLWSSGIVRAMETAKIISKNCGIDKIEIREFIETGDFNELWRNMNRLKDSCTVMIVGHEPDLSQWVNQICHSPIEMKKGAAVSIDLISTKILKGSINWLAEPGRYSTEIPAD
jgi:phosphohistidine phosphatase